MQKLLSALGEDIKPAGTDKWICRCPVHGDKDFAMSIRLNHDNSVIAHCFACGANGLELYRELGLDLDELFGGKDSGNFIPSKIKDTYTEDCLVIAIHKAAKGRGEYITLADNRRKRLAVARVAGIKEKYPGIAE